MGTTPTLLTTDSKSSTSATAGSSTGSYLIPRTLFGELQMAVRKRLVLRALAAKVIGPGSIPGSSIDIPLQTRDTMVVQRVTEGAVIPLDAESYSGFNLKPYKYGVRIMITREMQEDSMFDVMAKLRLCLFAEPVSIYRGSVVKLEVVLANEDILQPSKKYPVRLQIVGPDNIRLFDRIIEIELPVSDGKKELPFAFEIFNEEIKIDGPSGQYRFLANFEHGAAATGGEAKFYVTDVADMPSVETEVVLWGEDVGLEKWLNNHQIRTRKFDTNVSDRRELILVSNKVEEPGDLTVFRDLAIRMAKGSSVVFLSPEVFREDENTTKWLPVKDKGEIGVPANEEEFKILRWLYIADDWAKRHPVFDELPSGTILDYAIYRDIIPDKIWFDGQSPSQAVAGTICTSIGYSSGLILAVQELGAGQFILNTMHIRQNLEKDPTAERLLRNMLNYAARDIPKPAEKLPDDFENQLKLIGL